MEAIFKPSFGGEAQFYYSDNFLIQLNLHKNGLVTGWIVHYPIGLNLAKAFRGICSDQEGKLNLAFFIEWNHPNQNDPVLTVYSGEICEYEDNKNRLFVQWIQLGNDIGIKSPARNGNEILAELTQNDEIITASKNITFDISKETLGGYRDLLYKSDDPYTSR